MTRQRLPIGIQSFARLRETCSYYVDKTSLIRDLIERGDHWFLSRPRRFGKSLLVDTIKALFEGQEALFRGLAIHGHWDWSVTHPVVRLSFDRRYDRPEDIERSIANQLGLIEHAAGLEPLAGADVAPERLQTLLYHLHHKTGQRVVILVDEYDKPILDALSDPDRARANRDYLRGVYGIIKGAAEHVRFVFVTGVSMFSKVSLFSDLNNLKDISLDPRYATLCGYTDADLDTVFAPELAGLDREAIRTWYNGYHWLGDARLYNPFDVLLLLNDRKFKPYWFQTGSPRFLFETLKRKSVSPLDLEGCLADESLVSKFDVDDIGAEALLFQTGYLTITDEEQEGFNKLYRLDYPNQEVRISLNQGLLQYLGKTVTDVVDQGRGLRSSLETHDFAGFAATLKAWLASIPYQWHTTGDLARYEAWYASLLHMAFRSIGVDVRGEAATSHGRADMVVSLGEQVFILEFKMADGPDAAEATLAAAFTQMHGRGYADTYRDRTVHLVAIACGREARNLLEVRAEAAGIP